MPIRAATTILLITRQDVVRADFTRSSQLLGMWDQARPDSPNLAGVVATALTMGPRPGKRVWVLTSDLWTQTLNLETGKTRDMATEDLASALNFEAEALSGLSAFDSMIGYQPLPDDQGFWIVQIRAEEVANVAEVVQAAGSQLAGIGHPGGLPQALKSSAGPWQRLELWPDAVICLAEEEGSRPRLQVLNTDPQLGRWAADWQAWRTRPGMVRREEILVGPGVSGPQSSEAPPIRLEDEASLADWLTIWARELNTRRPLAPLLRPARRPMALSMRLAIGLGLAVAALAGCIFHGLWLNQREELARTQLKETQLPAQQLADLEKQFKDLEAKKVKIKAEQNHLVHSLVVINLQRQRLGLLLGQLRAHHHEDLLLEKIDTEAGEPRLAGICLVPDLADRYANHLGQTLRAVGWEVHSPKMAAEKKLANGGPWTFEISFTSVGPFVPAPRPAAKKGPAEKTPQKS